MTVLDRERKESWSGSVLERQALAFHYRYCERNGAASFPPDLIHKIPFREGLGVVYMASTGARLTALYSFEKSDIGYRFRALSSELEGRAISRALLKTKADDLSGLAELGLSYREIANIAALPLRDVRQKLGAM